ncbi:hypothetical protein [Saccharomonospora xinjiangensis]|uniref:Uncharacterized protein n=1 Tax=Saccharomonospora xinjiangensis XJ-54 TaxID=882086 RepID=I0UYV9_9PSEU|nr:hypothetical protein [Saccharomonospora xinjiangensis]EID53062.1 hypothetical protein SacxiDRAFT_0797 [Saccharomonospora xinjiangensis XJ-54]
MSAPSDGEVRLRPLSVVEDGDEVVIGDPESGTFVTIPPVGGVVVRALQRGAGLRDAAEEAEAFAGEPVDVAAFVEVLTDLGFVDDGAGKQQEVERTAAIQNKRWLAGVSQRVAAPFFGRLALAGYIALALFCVATFVAVPGLWPSSGQDAFLTGDIGSSALLLVPFALLSMALHEGGHWFAARAIGINARFGIDRRSVLLVFETDLTQVWTVPRRRRYIPLLGGIAVDVVVLSVLLGARLLVHIGVWSPPAIVDSTLAVWVYVKLAGLLWQCMVFLRSDLYAVLVNALGCRNLWRVKTLLLRRAFGMLTEQQRTELAGASPADVRVGLWFRWVWLAGSVVVLAWFAVFVLPPIVTMIDWTAGMLAAGPLSGSFWYATLCAGLLLLPQILVTVVAVKQFRSWLAGRRARAAA